MKDIYVNKEGVICACTVPFPNEKDFSGDQWKENAALQACKESAVPFDEKFSITVLLIDSFKDTSGKTMHEVMKDKIKPDTFYQIEADWEIVEVFSHCTPGEKHYKKVARLKVPAPIVATDNSGEQERDKFALGFARYYMYEAWEIDYEHQRTHTDDEQLKYYKEVVLPRKEK